MNECTELKKLGKKLNPITHEVNKLTRALDQLETAPVLESLNREDRRRAEKDLKKVLKIQQRLQTLGSEGEIIAESMRELINSGKRSIQNTHPD